MSDSDSPFVVAIEKYPHVDHSFLESQRNVYIDRLMEITNIFTLSDVYQRNESEREPHMHAHTDMNMNNAHRIVFASIDKHKGQWWG